jgi:sulfotransferase family protein
MVESGMLPTEPVFVVCNARSGSTLLRYLLDAHPDIACPAETKVMHAARSVLNVNNDLAGNPTVELQVKKHGVPQPTPGSVTAARNFVTGLVSEYLDRHGKTVWCHKSLDTVHALDMTGRLFPRARYICLHRHAMDVAASMLESCRWGYGYFDIQPYVARHYNNIPQALAEYWTVRTKIMLMLEQSAAAPTHVVHYEHLVRDPESTLAGILEFLNLARDDKLVRKMIEEAFHIEHDPGAADWKIPFASAIQERSVERGRAIPGELIRPPVRDEMNAMLARMRYPVVDADWNTSSDVGDRTDRSLLSAAPVSKRVGALVDGLLAPRLAAYEGPVVRPARLTATYGDGQQVSWLIDSSAKKISCLDGGASPPLSITTRAEVLQALLTGGLPSQSAQRLDMLPVTGASGEDESQAVSRFLTTLLTA